MQGTCAVLEHEYNIILSGIRSCQLTFSTIFSCIGRLNTPRACIYGVNSLQYLDISHIGLTSLPCIHGLTNLRTLNASNNRLGYLVEGWRIEEEFFWGQNTLEILDLSDNYITTIPYDILIRHPNLVVLNLAENRLESSSFLLSIPVGNQFQMLNISFNALAYLSPKLLCELENFHPSSTVDLQGNPFLCVCAFRETLVWIQSTKLEIVSQDKLICADEGSRQGTYISFHELNISALCPFKSVTIGLMVASGTIVVCILLAATIIKQRKQPLVCYYVLKWKLKGNSYGQGRTNYDVYIIYNTNSHTDRSFVTQFMTDTYEDKHKCKLFIWDRDSVPGTPMAEEIVRGMISSKKIIIVHSKYLFAEYCMGDACVKQPLLGGESVEDETEIVSEDNLSASNWTVEWIDYTLLAAMRFIKDKQICVVKRGNVYTKDVSSKWHPLLFPNEYFSPIVLLKERSKQFELGLLEFIMQ